MDLPHAEFIRATVPDSATVQAAAAAARGLSDATRLSMAAALAVGDELCVCDTNIPGVGSTSTTRMASSTPCRRQ